MLKNKNVLITGADGFIGSHLVEMLVQKSAKVRALSYYNSFNDWGWIEDVSCKEDIEIITGDIRDYNCCQKITKGIDVVFHLAALVGIPYSYYSPKSYIETNVGGTHNMCHASLENGVQKLIHTSTSEVYGTALYVPIDEKHPMQAQSPYSASKIGADSIAISYFYSFDLPVAIVRPFNTYGPRQSARAVIPAIITQLLGNTDVVELGDISTTRDFNYVIDTCKGFVKLAETENSIGEVVNVGSNHEISIRDLFYKINKIMESDAVIKQNKFRYRPDRSEVRRLLCDSSKLTKLTGFQILYSIDEGLKKTIEWFKKEKNRLKYKAGVYNV
jgi:NAD dependent epimerase/dehydratase